VAVRPTSRHARQTRSPDCATALRPDCRAGLACAIGSPPGATVATADVLAKIHDANQKEIRMGKMAEKHGKDKQVLSLAKTVVKDHTSAGKKVTSMAKKENIDLPASSPSNDEDMSGMAKGSEFDNEFAKSMLDDHKKTISELTQARDTTADTNLKDLITELLPKLQKHEEMAQRILDKTK
jgi:putative membrane protein